jgi:hypothetical protein
MRGGVASALRRRRRVRLDLLLGGIAVLAVVAAILVQQGGSSSPGLATSSPQPLAAAFAQAYLGYLDGRVPAHALPNATDGVRATAAGAAPIPARARQGSLKLARLRVTYVRGALSGQALAVGRDLAHTYGFQIELQYVHGRWQVTDLSPPDVNTITATPYRPPAAPPALRLAAGSFALAYAA